MNIARKDSRSQFFIAAVVFFCLIVCVVLYIYLCLRAGGFQQLRNGYGDVKIHHTVRAYTLKGFNPFLYAGKEAPINGLEKVSENFAAVPWSLTLGNFFYAGFLPVRFASIYNTFMHLIVYLFTAALIYKTLAKKFTAKITLLLSLLPLAHFSYMYSLWFGNDGGIICLLILDALILARKKPYFSGVLIALSMCKPQVGGLFCLVMLLRGYWKTLITGAFIDIISWFAASVCINTPMLELLKQSLFRGVNGDNRYLGILSPLMFLDINRTVIMLCNILIGIAYTLIFYYWFSRYKKTFGNTFNVIIYFPACIASNVWMYKNGCDYLILVYASALIVFMCTFEKLSRRDFYISLLCMLYFQLSRCLVYAAILLVSSSPLVRSIFKSLDGLAIMIIGTFICKLFFKYKPLTND